MVSLDVLSRQLQADSAVYCCGEEQEKQLVAARVAVTSPVNIQQVTDKKLCYLII